MMASSSCRTWIQDYLHHRMCMVCLRNKDHQGFNVYHCLFCQSVYHNKCLESIPGMEDGECCRNDFYSEKYACCHCRNTGGLQFSKENQRPYHLMCEFNRKFVENRSVTDGSILCSLCLNNRGEIFFCSSLNKDICGHAFHQSCHLRALLSLPGELERIFWGKIILSCALHNSSEKTEILRMFRLLLKRTEEKLPDELMVETGLSITQKPHQFAFRNDNQEEPSCDLTIQKIVNELGGLHIQEPVVEKEAPLEVALQVPISPQSELIFFKAFSPKKNESTPCLHSRIEPEPDLKPYPQPTKLSTSDSINPSPVKTISIKELLKKPIRLGFSNPPASVLQIVAKVTLDFKKYSDLFKGTTESIFADIGDDCPRQTLIDLLTANQDTLKNTILPRIGRPIKALSPN